MNVNDIEEKIIINKEVIYHDDNDVYKNFGILKIKTDKIKKCEKEEKLIIFTIDRSGSMMEKCSDNNTKIEHIIFTLENIIKYFVNMSKNEDNLLSVSIIIMTFDKETKIIVEKTKITEEKSIEIINKIKGITAENPTNFEKPLELVKKIVKENMDVHTDTRIVKENMDVHTDTTDTQLYDSSQITHIFMTDGEITDGKKCISELVPLINTEIQNIFIGFGIYHDADLLNKLSNLKNGKYYFIDVLENSGLVYGEITHEIVNKILENIEIILENGLIYDWKTNKWEKSILLDNLVKDKEKIFQIKREKEEIKVKINYTIPNINHEKEKKQIVIECLDTKKEDLTRYVYRQKTQELLYRANKINSTINNIKNENDYQFNERYNHIKLIQEKKEVKREIKNLFDLMKEYMNNYGLSNDPLMKLLCDDMYITYRTFENTNSHYYSRARQVSQGTQQIYTVSNISTPSQRANSTPRPNFRTPRMARFSQDLLENHRNAPLLIPQPIRRGTTLNENERQYHYINTNIEINRYDDDNEKETLNECDIETYIPNYDTLEELDLYSYNYFNPLNDEIGEEMIDLNFRYELSQYTESPFISPSTFDFMSSISTRTIDNNNENNNNESNSDTDYDVSIL